MPSNVAFPGGFELEQGYPFSPPYFTNCTVTATSIEGDPSVWYGSVFVRYPRKFRIEIPFDTPTVIENLEPGTVLRGHVPYLQTAPDTYRARPFNAQGSGENPELASVDRRDNGGWIWYVDLEEDDNWVRVTFDFEPIFREPQHGVTVNVRSSADYSAIPGHSTEVERTPQHSFHPGWSMSANRNIRNDQWSGPSDEYPDNILQVPDHEDDPLIQPTESVTALPLRHDTVVLCGEMSVQLPIDSEADGFTVEVPSPSTPYEAIDDSPQQFNGRWYQEYDSGYYVIACRVGSDGMLGEAGTPQLIINSDWGSAFAGDADTLDDNRLIAGYMWQDPDDASSAEGAGAVVCQVDPDTLEVTVGTPSEFFTGVAGVSGVSEDFSGIVVAGVSADCALVGLLVENLETVEWWEPPVVYPSPSSPWANPSWYGAAWWPSLVPLWVDGLTFTAGAEVQPYVPTNGPDDSVGFDFDFGDFHQLDNNKGVWVHAGTDGSGVAVVVQADPTSQTITHQSTLFQPSPALAHYIAGGSDPTPTDGSLGIDNSGYWYGRSSVLNSTHVLACGWGPSNSTATPEIGDQPMHVANLLRVDGLTVTNLLVQDIGLPNQNNMVCLNDRYAIVASLDPWEQDGSNQANGYFQVWEVDLNTPSLTELLMSGPIPAGAPGEAQEGAWDGYHRNLQPASYGDRAFRLDQGSWIIVSSLGLRTMGLAVGEPGWPLIIAGDTRLEERYSLKSVDNPVETTLNVISEEP